MDNEKARNLSRKKWLAYCVATYNRPDVVAEVLSHLADEYRSYDIDMYYYDSSDNDDTYHVVNRYIERGYENIYYIRVDSSVKVDDKLLSILKGEGQQYEYTYIWPVKDRAALTASTIEVIYKAHEEDVDAIFLGSIVHPNKIEYPSGRTGYYEDAEEFFGDWGMCATSLDVTIFHYNKLLKNIDWESFRNRYFVDEECHFSHYAALFQSLAAQESPRIKVIEGNKTNAYVISSARSSWRSRAFEIWIKHWLHVNKSLPPKYDRYKEKVVKQTTSLPWIFGSTDALMTMSDDKIFTPEVYEQYKMKLPLCSEISADIIEKIVRCEYQIVTDMIFQDFNERMQKEEYFEVYQLFRKNSWIDQYLRAEEYKILTEVILIYEKEILGRSQKNIFYRIKNYKAAIEKYTIVRHYVEKINLGIEPEDWWKFAVYVKKQQISSIFLTHIVLGVASDQEHVLSAIERIFADYGAAQR